MSGSEDDSGGIWIIPTGPILGDGSAIKQFSDSTAGTLKSVAVAVQEAGSFRAAVLGVVLTAIVGGILNIGFAVIDAIRLAFEPIVEALALASASLIEAGRPAGNAILEAFGSVLEAVSAATGAAGFAAPIVTVGIVIGLVYLIYRFAVSFLADIPVIGGTLRFLGRVR